MPNRKLRLAVRCCLRFLLFWLGGVSAALAAGVATPTAIGDMQTALGLAETFGRWNSPVRLGYNPQNAPARYADPDTMQTLLREAADRWERISGIRFEILPADQYPDDRSRFIKDGIVQVSWVSNTGSFAGRASALFGNFDTELGYYPYIDGYIELSIEEFPKESALNLGPLATLTHELGHVIGLGHSDIPHSLMYANPYNRRGYPAEDDIRIAQVLYGPPAQVINPAAPVKDWVFPLPATASETETRYLFKQNQHSLSPKGPIVMLESDPFTEITDVSANLPEDALLGLVTPIGDFENPDAIDLSVSLVLVSPEGYADAIYSSQFQCAARHACITGIYASTLDRLRNVPGRWRMYLVADLESNPRLLHASEFRVEQARSVNAAPRARVLVAPGDTETTARIRLLVEDSENDVVRARWYTTGNISGDGGSNLYYESVFEPGKRSPWETLDFRSKGSHTLFVEVNDDAERYAGTAVGNQAGAGYRTLLRITLNLPLQSQESVAVESSSLQRNRSNDQHLAGMLQDYQPSAEWPIAFNGVVPQQALDAGVNNIGVVSDDATRISTCVAMQLDGAPRFVNGSVQFDIGFRVVDLDNGIIALQQSRPFNQGFALMPDETLPDCSGRFDFFTAEYSDVLRFGDQEFRVRFDLVDSDRARFRLRKLESLSPSAGISTP